MEENLRKLITEKSLLLRDIDSLGPLQASQELVELSSLLSLLNREIAEANYWDNVKKMELLKEHGIAAKAKIYAEATQEWRDWTDRVQQGKAVEAMIGSIKYYLRNSEAEMKHLSK